MKYQYYTLGFALAALVCSCNNEDVIEQRETFNPEKLVFNIKVDSPQSITDTRATKTGWAENDRLYMWFDACPDGATPDLVLEYHVKINGNDDKWEPVADVQLSGNAPQPSGKVWAYYESHNNGSVFNYGMTMIPEQYGGPYPVSAIPMVAYAWAQDYTYTYSAEEDRGSIEATLHWYTRNEYNRDRDAIEELLGSEYYLHWDQWPDESPAKRLLGVGYTNVQVVIHGMSDAQKSKKWALKCPMFNNISQVYPGGWYTSLDQYTLNVPNPDGPEFYFKNDSQNYGLHDYVFLLLDLSDEANPVQYKYTVEQKEWDSQVDRFRSIKLHFGDFTKVVE